MDRDARLVGGYGAVHPGESVTPLAAVLVSGLAIPGAAFVLAWVAETAEKDVPQAFAIAVLAVLAVALEYAVDALYTWQAGPGSAAAGNLADAVTLDRDLATETRSRSVPPPTPSLSH